MIASVLSRARHLLSRSVFGSSLAGDGLLVRLRSTSIGLLGVVTAVGLGLIAFISQLGWPGVFNAPIPGSPHEAGAVHGAVALTRPAPRVESALPAHGIPAPAGSGTAISPGGPGGVSGPGSDSGVGGSRDLGVSAAAHTPSRTGQSPPAPAPEPVGEPVATVPVPPPAASPPSATVGPSTSSSGSGSKDDSRTDPKPPHETAGVKPPSDEIEKETPPPAQPEGDKDRWKSWKSKHYSDPPKPGYVPGKSSESKADIPPPAAAPPVVSPSPKDPLANSVHGDDEDAGYAGKSDKRRH